MAIPTNTVQSGAEAIKEVAGLFRGLTDLLREWIAGADIRRMRKAIEAGERYIRTAGPLIKKHFPKDEARVVKELGDQEAMFFKYN